MARDGSIDEDDDVVDFMDTMTIELGSRQNYLSRISGYEARIENPPCHPERTLEDAAFAKNQELNKVLVSM